jgi:hypothetical protein
MEQQLFGQALATPAELQQALLRELAHACPKPRIPWRQPRD